MPKPASMPSMPSMGEQRPYAAVVLAGGAGRRLGGVAKPVLPVAGQPMLHRVLAAVAGADPRVVVGPDQLPVPPDVAHTQEQPPGGGPVPAIAAGLALVPDGVPDLAVLAADLPLLTGAAIRRLLDAAAGPGRDGAVFVDSAGRPQWLCGVWRTGPLRARLAALGPELAGLSMRRLLGDGDLSVARLTDPGPGPPPWWDCDTDADLQRAAAELTGG
ncbi:MAG: NTP transferase domain-containing protein [Micromonosporaceae bacterium]|nr:NTP transferase domain-containing protein [Micromonosporaceae bacterium]